MAVGVIVISRRQARRRDQSFRVARFDRLVADPQQLRKSGRVRPLPAPLDGQIRLVPDDVSPHPPPVPFGYPLHKIPVIFQVFRWSVERRVRRAGPGWMLVQPHHQLQAVIVSRRC